ncbi:MAG: hypothetical protein AAFW87_03720 [Pseudomonadota bacterium]
MSVQPKEQVNRAEGKFVHAIRLQDDIQELIDVHQRDGDNVDVPVDKTPQPLDARGNADHVRRDTA